MNRERETASGIQPDKRITGPGASLPDPTAPAELFAEYDELAGDVSRSTHVFFQGNLKRWLNFLDRTSPFARPILQQLEMSADFKTWFEPHRRAMLGLGGAAVEWPSDQLKRLGLQLLLFRDFANGSTDSGMFALTVLHTGQHINDGIRAIIDQMFIPMSRELRRFLATAVSASAANPIYAPAADRIVTLDHNSEAYAATVKALEDAEEAVAQGNDYPDPEDKEQRLAELSAGRRLLSAVRVRPAAVMTV